MRPCLFSYLDAANIGSLRRRLNHDDELSLFLCTQSEIFFLVHVFIKAVCYIAYAAESWVLPPRQQRCLDFLAQHAEDHPGRAGS